jgi:dipeptidyl-peptidase-4
MYRVSIADRRVERITKQPGTHDVTIAPDESAFVDRYSNVSTPPRQDLYRANGVSVAAINENKVAELSSYPISHPEFVTLSASDGTKLYAMLIKPPHFDAARKYPVLIDVYGGPQVQNVRDDWGGNNFLWLESMAEKGYVIFSLDNRGSYNRGHAFETPVYHQFGKVELQDQLTGVNYLKALSFVDGDRIGIWGWSYGGFMTLDAMFDAPGVFKAGVSVAPVSDWRLYDTIYTERYMGRPQDDPEGYTNSSPGDHSSALLGKLLLAHGTGDDNVHFANTSEVINQMILGGKYPTDLVIFPGRGHAIADRPARIQLFERITQFFTDNL